MRNGRGLAILRMVVGCALGVAGFGTLSAGFVDLRLSSLLLGAAAIAAGTFIALGVLVPLRRAPGSSHQR
jgi:hypothetical protein